MVQEWVSQEENGFLGPGMGFSRAKWVSQSGNGLFQREMGFMSEEWVSPKGNGLLTVQMGFSVMEVGFSRGRRVSSPWKVGMGK
ncbi:hypothetical protein [Lederbergia ruris]|uniref:hypothetical protein n=1 Tax=Lederbergia ruris TaxID=217495 RepID=UPI0039A05760